MYNKAAITVANCLIYELPTGPIFVDFLDRVIVVAVCR